MRIAIQAADLDHARIDGTRVYIFNLLKYFGKLDQASDFLIYHKDSFNSELTPPEFPNYTVKKIRAPYFWTQLRFAFEIRRDKIDALWMPMHNMPILCSGKTKTTVTIHDLAFKHFPESFPKIDLLKLNFLTDLAVRRSDRIIAISEATKRDILDSYPKIEAEKIKVIYHGFSPDVYALARNLEKEKEIKNCLGIKGNYILYFGAIQPRKNLEVLIAAFNQLKKETFPDLQLVLAGEKAWLSAKTIEMAQKSPFAEDIIMPGRLKFDDLGHLCRGAGVFVFPSLYEGFGIPVLEAMAAKVPVVCANNSSLPEVGGEAAVYFDAANCADLAGKISAILRDEVLRQNMIAKGLEQIKKFSWAKCARETLEYLKSS
ncbi:MAG: glycosyltransferase family 1 protein [Parcubacteria group bacterium]|jgi:glycosyltransferase involved in cell wall biosynthesis